METKHLHIVSFDVPYPPDYGGAIDIYYRILALKELGVKITLHCYEYGRGNPEELSRLADHVYYYKRKKHILQWLSRFPFIVRSRNSEELMSNLLKDHSPILFEGIHTTYFLNDHRLNERVQLVRTHNIEHEYYEKLAQSSSGLKRFYFSSEARKLRRYEPVLQSAKHLFAIKESDRVHFSKYTGTSVLPASIPSIVPKALEGTEPFCVYHGNLSVAENEHGARWLIEKVFVPAGLTNRLIIAGKDPGAELTRFCSQNNVRIVTNPDMQELEALMIKARIHVFYTDQNTGVKLKLLSALSYPGHVLVNPAMVEGSDLDKVCILLTDEDSWRSVISDLINQEVTPEEYTDRLKFLSEKYDTKKNCQEIFLPYLS